MIIMTTMMTFDNRDDNCEHLIDDDSDKGEDDTKAWNVFEATKTPIVQSQGLHILNMMYDQTILQRMNTFPVFLFDQPILVLTYISLFGQQMLDYSGCK